LTKQSVRETLRIAQSMKSSPRCIEKYELFSGHKQVQMSQNYERTKKTMLTSFR